MKVEVEESTAGGRSEGGAQSAHDLPGLGPLLQVPFDLRLRCAEETGEPVSGGDRDVAQSCPVPPTGRGGRDRARAGCLVTRRPSRGRVLSRGSWNLLGVAPGAHQREEEAGDAEVGIEAVHQDGVLAVRGEDLAGAARGMRLRHACSAFSVRGWGHGRLVPFRRLPTAQGFQQKTQ